MSFRGEDESADAMLGALAAEQRSSRETTGRGPFSVGPAALLARGVQVGATETADYLGVPSGDPHFLLTRITGITLHAGRWYAVVGITEVDKVTAGSGLLDVIVASSPVYASATPSIGTGVLTHTVVRRNRHLYSGTGNDHSVDILAIFEQGATQTGVEFALIAQTDLEPTGGSDHVLALVDIGIEG